jgi:hypothetical protein
LVSRHRGKASRPPNSLNSIALPSITGIAASGPMSPSPSTAVPSETIATVLLLIASAHAFAGSSWIAIDPRPTAERLPLADAIDELLAGGLIERSPAYRRSCFG